MVFQRHLNLIPSNLLKFNVLNLNNTNKTIFLFNLKFSLSHCRNKLYYIFMWFVHKHFTKINKYATKL